VRRNVQQAWPAFERGHAATPGRTGVTLSPSAPPRAGRRRPADVDPLR